MFTVKFTGFDGNVIDELTTTVEEGKYVTAPEMEDIETLIFV